jgi:phage host-nuclease inhibitor protein Gam
MKIFELWRIILHKIPQVKRYKEILDNNYKEIQLYKKDIFTLQLEVERLKQEKADLNNKISKLNLTKEQPLYNEISKPDLSIKQIEASMKLVDKFTLNQIIHYLKLDTFELVKNIA